MYKVSVIVPIYNVSRYLRQCLDSICAQTLKELEIICVDDGSTDDSLEIIREYAAKDDRIVVLTGPNGGYGKAMNRGLDCAAGEYVGIVEPDDYVDVHMYEELYACASGNDLDFVKSDFYRFSTRPSGEENLVYEQIDKSGKRYGELLNPSEDPDTIRFTMNTWTGIYRREYIEKNHIRHQETPGASFQDNGFFFQTFIYGKRAMIINKAYYRNRRDNPDSSVKSREKVYCMNIEYDFIRDILMSDREIWERFKYMYWWIKYHNYMFTYDRIDAKYKKEYLGRMRMEYKRAMQKGELSRDVFSDLEWKKLESLIESADGFYDALRSASLFRKLVPYVPEWAKRLVFKVMSRRK